MSEPCLKDECCQLRKLLNEYYGPENSRLKDALDAQLASMEAMKKDASQRQQIIDHIDRFYVSGNSVPIDKPWINATSWGIAKELLAHGLPLEHDLIEREGVYRKKLLAYGDETRAKSPLQERLAALAGERQSEGEEKS